MIQVGGVFLPDGETHLVDWMKQRNEVVDGKLTYQYHKLQAALGFVRNWRTAIDVGAHCGLWSMHLVKRFDQVEAFEPLAAHRACFLANVPASEIKHSGRREAVGQFSLVERADAKATLHPVALGEGFGFVKINTAPTSSGDSWVDGEGEIPMLRLDDYRYMEHVDFLKIDCEGYELRVLRGAEAMLERCRPCVIVEQKPGHAQRFGHGETEAVDYLKSLGAKLRREMSGDFILSWD